MRCDTELLFNLNVQEYENTSSVHFYFDIIEVLNRDIRQYQQDVVDLAGDLFFLYDPCFKLHCCRNHTGM